MYKIPKKIIRTDTRINNRIIPYKIHQTFKTNIVTENTYKVAMSLINLNPHYNYYFYDNVDIIKYIENIDCDSLNFTKDELINAYNKIKPGAGKADIFRLIIIYYEGGCYFDIDFILQLPLDNIIDYDDEVFQVMVS